MKYFQQSLFDSNIPNDIRLLSYLDFKSWLAEKFPMFTEGEEEKWRRLSCQTFLFEWGKRGHSISLRNFILEKDKGQRISINVNTSKTSGYGAWATDLDELEEEINEAFKELGETRW